MYTPVVLSLERQSSHHTKLTNRIKDQRQSHANENNTLSSSEKVWVKVIPRVFENAYPETPKENLL